ncbi:MAG: MFS transporter, partial [Actinobacteria bacterium]|nr:MFS transporter [Actinomycetota bacterium]
TLLFGLLQVGQSVSALGVPAWSIVAVACGLLALFLWHESLTDEPLIPIHLFRIRLFSISNSSGFLAGAVLMGIDSFVPPFVQGVLGGTAISAGMVLAPMSISWTIATALSGRMMVSHGYRHVVILGFSLILASTILLLVPMDRRMAQPWLMLTMLVMGFGMGFAMTSFLVAVQSSVGWSERGIATASVSFFQNIGGAVGVSIMGGLLNSGMYRGLMALDPTTLGAIGAASGVSAASVVLDPVTRSSIPTATLEALRSVLASSLYSVYVAIVAVSIAGLVLALFFPRGCATESDSELGSSM